MRTPKFGVAAVIIACLAGSFAALPAVAQESDSPPNDSVLRRVRVTINARSQDAHALEGLLFEWFGSSAPHLQLSQVEVSETLDIMTPSHESDLLRVWIAFKNANLARVYFADPASERFFLREVPLHHGLDEIAREQLAQVVVTSSLAFIDRRVSSQVELVQRSLHLANGKGSFPDQPPERTLAPESEQPRWFPRLGANYTLGLEQAGVWRHGPGLLIGVSRQSRRRRLVVDFRAHYFWPTTVTAPDVLLSLRTLGTRLSVGYESLFDGFSLGGEAGVALDVVHYEPRSNSSTNLTPSCSANQWRPGGYFGIRVARDFDGVRLTLPIGLTVYESSTRYAIVRDGQPQTEYSPFTVQPRAALEVSWR